MFRFKEFTVHQEHCSMKVGTDGVLLGAWARCHTADAHILDIGTGTGVIALMMAQRTSARVTGVEIDRPSAEQAARNAAQSPWANRVEVLCSPIQSFRPATRFDLILSNPPYFVDSLLPPDAARSVARHTTSLSFSELTDAVVRMLSSCGRFALILPTSEMPRFEEASRERLFVSRRCEVHTTPETPAKRIMAEFSTSPVAEVEHQHLTIESGGTNNFSDEYRALTKDFYLKF